MSTEQSVWPDGAREAVQRAHEADHGICAVCAGKGTPVSGGACICGGVGTQAGRTARRRVDDDGAVRYEPIVGAMTVVRDGRPIDGQRLTIGDRRGYDQGHHDGECSASADWIRALNEVGGFSDRFDYTPTACATAIAELRANLAAAEAKVAALRSDNAALIGIFQESSFVNDGPARRAGYWLSTPIVDFDHWPTLTEYLEAMKNRGVGPAVFHPAPQPSDSETPGEAPPG